jgi:hypothetical protein
MLQSITLPYNIQTLLKYNMLPGAAPLTYMPVPVSSTTQAPAFLQLALPGAGSALLICTVATPGRAAVRNAGKRALQGIKPSTPWLLAPRKATGPGPLGLASRRYR